MADWPCWGEARFMADEPGTALLCVECPAAFPVPAGPGLSTLVAAG